MATDLLSSFGSAQMKIVLRLILRPLQLHVDQHQFSSTLGQYTIVFISSTTVRP